MKYTRWLMGVFVVMVGLLGGVRGKDIAPRLPVGTRPVNGG
jgi:hypothetical protein